MRLINADELAEELSERVWFMREDEKQAVRIVKEFPTVDAVSVRHGRWIEHGEPNERQQYEVWYWSCSLCGAVGLKEMNYCPNCGAKMDGGANDAAID